MKHRVLLVDDGNESLLRLLGNSFSVEAYEVVLADGVQQAIEKSDAGEIDLLLMRLDSRTDEGWQAIVEITEENPFLPVIVITRQPELRNLAEAAGAYALVEMPVDVPALRQSDYRVAGGTGPEAHGASLQSPGRFSASSTSQRQFSRSIGQGYTTPYRFNTPALR